MAKATTQTKKTDSKPAPTKSTAVAKKQTGAVASAEEMAKMMAGDAGKGVSTAMEDNVVPLIYILQAQSPQAQKKKEEYIDGAEAGYIWFRGTKSLVDGEDGILAQPCYFSKSWIEWMPNRGGFVARHDERPADAVQKTDPQNPKRKFWERPNGNIVVETREHVVLVHEVFDRPTPFVIPMSGSNHTASRGWMGAMNRKIIPGSDEPAPSFGFLYRLRTTFRTNDQGDWYAWDIQDELNDNDEPAMVTDVEAYKAARKICDDFSRGTLKAQAPEQELGDDGDDARGGGGQDHI